MFEFLRRLTGKGVASTATPANKTQAHFARLNEVAPLKPADSGISPVPEATPAPTGSPIDRSFVCRDPILDRNERIAGYEFSLHRKLTQRLLNRSEIVRKVYDDALLRNLLAMDLATLLGHRKAFIHLAPPSLSNPLIGQLPVSHAVLMLTPVDESAEALMPAVAHLHALQERGFSVGWSLRAPQPTWIPLMTSTDFVQVDAPNFDGMEFKTLARDLRQGRAPARPVIRLLAREIPTSDDFNACFHATFDYFQGPFVSSRENWHPPKSEINRLKVLELLNLLRSGGEAEAIAASLKTEPVLTFKLLRYLNSPAMGLAREVTTIPQALMILGRDTFYRWLSLLLFDIRNPGYRERILTEQALTRGRLMELLAEQGPASVSADQLFLTGLFSLLDVLMGQPLPQMLQQVTLPDPVHDALLGQPGPLRALLDLVIATESSETEAITALAARCEISPAVVSMAAMKALGWVQSLTAVQGD